MIESGATGTVSSLLDLEERTLENAGTLTIDTAGGIQGSEHARIFNSGTLKVNSETGSGILGEGALTNTGTLEKAEGSGVAQIDFAIDNESLVQPDTGQLEFTGGGNSGQLTPETSSAARAHRLR